MHRCGEALGPGCNGYTGNSYTGNVSVYVRCLVDWLLGSRDPRTRGGHDSFLRTSYI